MLEEYRDLLTVEDLCEILMIGKNSAYTLLGKGAIPAFRIGRCWKIPKEAVKAYLGQANSVNNG